MNHLYRHFFKRLFDVIISIIILLLFLPVLFILLILMFLTGHRRFFFVQHRPGYKEKVFALIKLRTMTEAIDVNGKFLPDEMRLTSFGKFLRKSSLDEIPQFWNVLKGEMSIIGPRPLLMEYLPMYSTEEKKRHAVKPGITGWAQVNGRNSISWESKFALDLWYVSNLSFLLDLRIVFLTIKKVIKKDGINQKGQSTVEPFKR